MAKKEIKKVVVMCGFVSVENLIASNFSGLLKGYRKDVLEVETNANPKYVGYNAINSLKYREGTEFSDITPEYIPTND